MAQKVARDVIMGTKWKILLLLIFVSGLVGTVSAEQRITNGDFSTGDTTGWTHTVGFAQVYDTTYGHRYYCEDYDGVDRVCAQQTVNLTGVKTLGFKWGVDTFAAGSAAAKYKIGSDSTVTLGSGSVNGITYVNTSTKSGNTVIQFILNAPAGGGGMELYLVGADSENLLFRNAADGFEVGKLGDSSDYSWGAAWGGSTVTRDTGTKHSGNTSVKVVGTTGGGGIYSYPKIPVNASTTYRMSAWGKDIWYDTIAFYNGTTACSPSTDGNWTDWGSSMEYNSHTFTTPSNCTRVEILFYREDNNPFYVDDIKLEEISSGMHISPIQYINDTKFLPKYDQYLPPEGTSLQINATPGEFEAASFIIKPVPGATGIEITATDLSDGLGHTIPKENTTIRTVKMWHQAAYEDIWADTMYPYQVPELLLYNDSIVRVNYTGTGGAESTKTNEVWVDNNGTGQWVGISEAQAGTWSKFYKIYDNATTSGFPQLFNLPAGENKQIWLTTYVPEGQTAGNYTGTIYINSSISNSTLTYNVRVLPFTLQEGRLRHGMYYAGETATYSSPPYWNVTDHWPKSTSQHQAELQDMKDHGILYPCLEEYESGTNFNTMLDSYIAVGMPTDRLYLSQENLIPFDIYINGSFPSYDTTLATDPAILAVLSTRADTFISEARAKGFEDVYAYGHDEPSASDILVVNYSLSTVRARGAETYYAVNSPQRAAIAATNTSQLNLVGLNSTDALLYKAANPDIEIYEYANPQGGVEKFETYRENYGLELWNTSGYDGAFDFAYMQCYGQGYIGCWNDFDNGDDDYRDHMMAYPTSADPIDTIQLEGYREGVDDSRYADTLSYITGNTTEATSIVSAGLAAGQDMSVIRGTLIDHILAYEGYIHPTASFTKSRSIVKIPQTVTFTDTSTGPATNWTWDFGDG